jgi:hypothetical protein
VRLRIFYVHLKYSTSFLALFLGNNSCSRVKPSSSEFSFYLSPFYFIIFSNNNPNSMPIYQYAAPLSTSLEQPESMILISRPCLVAIGQNQPFSIAKVLSSNQEGNEPKVLSSNQEDNELLATPRESYNLLINLGLGLTLQDLVPLQYIYTSLDNITFGGVLLSLSISKARFVLIS